VVKRGDGAVGARAGKIVVTLDSSRIFEGGKARLSSEGASWVQQLAAVIGPVGRAHVEAVEAPKESGARSEDLVVRLQTIADAFEQGGVGFERVTVALPAEPSGALPADEDPGVEETEPPAAASPTAKAPKGGPEEPKPAAKPTKPAPKPGTVELVVSLVPRAA
jgi:hypothetical protein